MTSMQRLAEWCEDHGMWIDTEHEPGAPKPDEVTCHLDAPPYDGSTEKVSVGMYRGEVQKDGVEASFDADDLNLFGDATGEIQTDEWSLQFIA